jgi:hypothetical protein
MIVTRDLGLHGLLLTACSMVAGCTSDPPSIANLRLSSGQTVGEFVSASDTSVVLLYDPSDCFSCSGVLAQWIELRRQIHARVYLVFTRKPTDSEERQLAVYRVKSDGFLAKGGRSDQIRTPTEHLFIHGELADPPADPSSGTHARILAIVRTHPVDAPVGASK